MPAGARKGGFGLGISPGTVLFKGLVEHAGSVQATNNLNAADFYCRYLVVDDIWIPLAESLLIQIFSPIRNRVIDGFGNHDPGKGRANQQRSRWDMLHHGRAWTEKLRPNARSEREILENLAAFLAGREADEIEPPGVDEDG